MTYSKTFEVQQLKRITIEVNHLQMARAVLMQRLEDGEIVFDMNATVTEVRERWRDFVRSYVRKKVK